MSTIHRLLKRLLSPLAIAAATLVLPGCGGGGFGPYDPVGGTLEVRNSPFSFEGIDFVEISTPFGPSDSFDVFLAPGDRDFIDLIPDVYDVELFWSDGSSDLFFAVDVFAFETTVLTGEN